jgi:hypothetical protein
MAGVQVAVLAQDLLDLRRVDLARLHAAQLLDDRPHVPEAGAAQLVEQLVLVVEVAVEGGP